MRKETQACRKCKHTYAEVVRSGVPDPTNMSDLFRHADESECRKCGGRVQWVDERGVPLSASKRADEQRQRLLWVAGAVAVVVVLGVGLARHFLSQPDPGGQP